MIDIEVLIDHIHEQLHHEAVHSGGLVSEVLVLEPVLWSHWNLVLRSGFVFLVHRACVRS